MITLYTLPPAFGERNPSPFCLKVEMAMAHLKLDFRIETTLQLNKAPKGKAPWLDDNGIIADSEIILEHLDLKTDGGLFGDLTPAEVAIGTAFSRLADDHLYWLAVASRWLDDAWFENVKRDFFGNLPTPMNHLVAFIARRRMRQTYELHGLGRHTLAEQRGFLQRDLVALSNQVDANGYIASQRLTVYDFAVGSMLAAIMDNRPDTWVSAIANEYQPLRNYIERVQGEVGVYCRETP
jgi:glutathione S-transferase